MTQETVLGNQVTKVTDDKNATENTTPRDNSVTKSVTSLCPNCRHIFCSYSEGKAQPILQCKMSVQRYWDSPITGKVPYFATTARPE